MGAAPVGGGRRAARPRDPVSGSRRLHVAGRSRPRRASAGPALPGAWLALRVPSVCWAYLPTVPWAGGADVDSVWSYRAPARAALVRLRPALAGASTGGPGECDLGAGPARALDRALRPTRGTPAHPRVRAKNARRIHLPGPQTPRLGSGRDGHRRPRASESVAPGGLSQPLVAGASGRLVHPSWATHPLRSPRPPRERH